MRVLCLIFLIWFSSCSDSKHHEESDNVQTRGSYRDGTDDLEDEGDEDEYSDGMWCAEVEYYNSNTGTRNTYDLNVEVEGGELVQINWPNGGWLDETHFVAEDISSGECSFVSDKGYHYSVTLNDKGGCSFPDTYRMRRDMQEEQRISTCPKCGDEKEAYEDLCDPCQDKAETCPKCYGYKMEWEAICSSCEDEIEERKSLLESEEDY